MRELRYEVKALGRDGRLVYDGSNGGRGDEATFIYFRSGTPWAWPSRHRRIDLTRFVVRHEFGRPFCDSIRTLDVLLTILFFAAVIAILYVARGVIVTFAFAILLAYLIDPVVRFLQNHSLFLRSRSSSRR